MAGSVRELHEKAMKFAQDAMLEKEAGNSSYAVALYGKAFELEKEAAFLVKKDKQSEPTRSILFRSSASLAYQAEKYIEATQMVGEGLSGYPSKRVFQELNIINEKIKLAIYNIEKELTPESEGFIFHLVGNAIEYGAIYYNDFLKRADAMQKILRKTAVRMLNQPFGTRKDILVPSFHVPTGGSFSIEVSISFKKGENGDIFANPEKIVDEYIDCFDLLESGDFDSLSKRMGDSNHLSYFMSQSKIIAPDGNGVTSIDFIGRRKSASLSKIPKDIPLYISMDESEDNKNIVQMELQGILNYASKRSGNTIGIKHTDNKNYTISIDEGLSEYVRDYFDREVRIRGYGYDTQITRLDSIEELD